MNNDIIYPFSFSENQKLVRDYLDIYLIPFSKNSYKLQTEKYRENIELIAKLYNIELDNLGEYNSNIKYKNNEYTEGLYKINKLYSTVWDKKSPYDVQILFNFVMFISKKIDQIRGFPNSEKPKTTILRPFANIYHLINVLIIFIAILIFSYFLVKLRKVLGN